MCRPYWKPRADQLHSRVFFGTVRVHHLIRSHGRYPGIGISFSLIITTCATRPSHTLSQLRSGQCSVQTGFAGPSEISTTNAMRSSIRMVVLLEIVLSLPQPSYHLIIPYRVEPHFAALSVHYFQFEAASSRRYQEPSSQCHYLYVW